MFNQNIKIMERKSFKSDVATWVDNAKNELTDKLVGFLKSEGGRVVLFQPCIVVTMDTEDECEYTSYSEVVLYNEEVFFVNEDGGEDHIDSFTLDEILRVVDNL